MLNQKHFAVVGPKLLVLFLVILPIACVEAAAPDEMVRPQCCAGTWYPGDAEVLAKLVDDLLDKATPPELEGKPLAVISPHAGYRFSAPTAGSSD